MCYIHYRVYFASIKICIKILHLIEIFLFKKKLKFIRVLLYVQFFISKTEIILNYFNKWNMYVVFLDLYSCSRNEALHEKSLSYIFH